MPDFAEFMGSSYTRPLSQIQIQSERSANWRLERTVRGKSPFAMVRQPGLSVFSTTGINGPVRGQFTLNGHSYAVVGDRFLQIYSDGTFTDYSATSGVYLTDDGRKAWICGNPTQIMITSGGNGYISQSGTLQLIGHPDFPIGRAGACEFMDGYFIVTLHDSQQFQISALNDGTVWDASDISSAESRPDFIVAPLMLREELWLFGTQTIQPFYNSGNPLFPIEANQSGVIQSGTLAPETVCRIGHTIFWLELDSNGHGTLCRNQGYSRVAVTNVAIDSIWNTYLNMELAYAWTYQEGGHEGVRITFPNYDDLGSSITWDYDMTTEQWFEVPFWNITYAREEAHRGRTAVVCFGKLLVGDRANGKIYEMHSNYLSDAGSLIRRVRRCPHLYNEGRDIQYHRLELDGNKGIGLNVASSQPYYNPVGMLEYSNNGGKTFGNQRHIRFGPRGHYNYNSFVAGLGSSNQRVYQFTVTDPVDWAITAARLDYTITG